MRAASFVLHTPPLPEHRFLRVGRAWTIGCDQIAPMLAALRDANRWFCDVWQFDPANGRVFGIRSGLTTRREDGRLHLQAQRWSAWAASTSRLQLPYTDLYELRQRLLNQQQVIRRTERRRTAHGIYAHQ